MERDQMKSPLMSFLVECDGRVSHVSNPGDNHVQDSEGLHGFVTVSGEMISVVIVGELSIAKLALLRRSYPRILALIKNHHPNIRDVENASFITEAGEEIDV